jgi:hypothetical protein
MFSPDTGSVASSTPTADVLSFIDLLERIRQDGTSEYPNIIIVNEEFAERNRGFDITLVPEIEHRGYTRDAFHIRKTVSVAHAELFEAFIPMVGKYPTLADRAVMIRGPSQDFWNQDAERYHANASNINCPPTKKKHSAIQQAIGVDVSRQLEHTLLVFKRGTKLENHVFSDDAVYVDVVVNDMTATIKNGDDDLTVLGTTVFWQIAVAGGSKLASGKPKKKKLFA